MTSQALSILLAPDVWALAAPSGILTSASLSAFLADDSYSLTPIDFADLRAFAQSGALPSGGFNLVQFDAYLTSNLLALSSAEGLDAVTSVLASADWNVDLPVNKSGQLPAHNADGSPVTDSADLAASLTISQLATTAFDLAPYFKITDDGILLVAPVDGAVTSVAAGGGRSELRGAQLFNAATGTASLRYSAALVENPGINRSTVIGQIHGSVGSANNQGSSVYILLIKFYQTSASGGKIVAQFNSVNYAGAATSNGGIQVTLDANYTLGEKYNVEIDLQGGKCSVLYSTGDSAPSATGANNIDMSGYSGDLAYFKVGAYAQKVVSGSSTPDYSGASAALLMPTSENAEIEYQRALASGSADPTSLLQSYVVSAGAVSDTAADVSAFFDAIDADSAVTSITLKDSGTPSLSLTVAQALGDTRALAMITNANYTIGVLDTAVPISANLDALSGLTRLGEVTVDDNGAIAIDANQAVADAAAIGRLANANGSAYQLAVADTAANVTKDLSTLEADAAHLASIEASGGVVTVSVATCDADRAALDMISGGFAISDTAKNISAGLSTLESDANVASIAISDNAILSLTASEVIADSAALAELANANSAPYLLDISGSQTDIVNDASAIDALLAGRHVADVTQSNADGSSVVSTYDIGGKAYSETVADFSASGSLTSVDFVGLAYAAGDHVTFAANAGGGGTFAIETAAGATVATYATSATYAAGLYKVAADGSGDAMMRPGGATPYDFTNGGHADILWRDAANGATYLWEMNGATVTSASASTSTQVGANWRIEGVADFNNDGAADLLWEYLDTANSSDPLNGVYYISQQNGPSTIAGSGLVEQLSTQWKVAGVGDFSGNGMSDILFRNASTGQTYIDMMNGSSVNWAASGFTSARATNLDWSVAAIGDFTGDGDSDILWRYDNVSNASDPLNGALYEWDMNGTTVVSQGLLSQQPGSANWQVEGTGDFTGNGRSDILFRYEDAANASDPLNGATYIDFMNGANVTSGALTQWQIGNTWQVAGIGDYYGTGKSDILFQNVSSGSTYIWEMNGANVVAGASTSAQLGAGWTTQNGVLIG